MAHRDAPLADTACTARERWARARVRARAAPRRAARAAEQQMSRPQPGREVDALYKLLGKVKEHHHAKMLEIL